MSESFPEQQPGLPIFPDEKVWYEVKWSAQELAADPTLERTVRVPVDEIDLVPDGKMRSALWEQFSARQKGERHALIVFSERDGSYSHTVAIPRGPLLLPIPNRSLDTDGPMTTAGQE